MTALTEVTMSELSMAIAMMEGPTPCGRAASTVLTAQTADLVSPRRHRLPTLQGLFATMTALSELTMSELSMAIAMMEGPTPCGRAASTVPTAQTADL
eukprot:4070936-Pleurochrysis_carterae.AAC.1